MVLFDINPSNGTSGGQKSQTCFATPSKMEFEQHLLPGIEKYICVFERIVLRWFSHRRICAEYTKGKRLSNDEYTRNYATCAKIHRCTEFHWFYICKIQGL